MIRSSGCVFSRRPAYGCAGDGGDRGQVTVPVFDPLAPALVISPHADDALCSSSAVLESALGAVIIAMFTGGSSDLEAWQRTLPPAGHDQISLEFAPAHDRTTDYRSVEIMAAVASCCPTASLLSIPLGIGEHPDHLAIREAVFEQLLPTDLPVRLYADFAHLNPTVDWAAEFPDSPDALERLQTDGFPGMPMLTGPDEVIRLSDAQYQRKLGTAAPRLAGPRTLPLERQPFAGRVEAYWLLAS